MSNDLQAVVKCLFVFGSQLANNLCPRPGDPFVPARAEAVWKRFRRDVIAAGVRLNEFPLPIADWIRRLGQLARQFDELAQGKRIDSVVGRFDFALLESLIDEGEQLLKEYAPRPADPFAPFFSAPPTPTTSTTPTPSTSTPPTGTQQSEGEKPGADDPFADLRRFARAQLKGQERAVIEALCDAGGELPIADLAVKDGVGWDDEFQGFKDAQRRLNPKLKPEGWRLERRNNAGFLVTL